MLPWAEGITSLIRYSFKLITIFVSAESVPDVDVEKFNATLKKVFCKWRLFTAGHWSRWVKWNTDLNIRLREQGMDLLPLCD